ncbi:MAG: 3'-5' exonuclease [Candidatus Obscuribacterales bacterium]|nr:3'-5' exonuclease [Candidatus Obscuribacterales bacterium]
MLIPNPLPVHPHPEDRDEIIDWARALLEKREFVILDTETTGTDKSDEVVQIGIVDADGNDLIDSLVRPEKPRAMPEAAARVHGITMPMLASAPTFFDLAPKIIDCTKGRLVICYNDRFDMRLIRQTADKYELHKRGRKLSLESECAMLAYSQFIGEPGRYGDDYAWQKLPRLAVEKNHSAAEDCRLTLQLIQELAQVRKDSE